MEMLILTFGLFIIGAILGSFAMASVWRLRAIELRDLKVSGEKLDADDKKLLTSLMSKNSKIFSHGDRSICLHCHKELRWYDMIPVVSWLALAGKCRNCKKPIGMYEFWAEVGVGAILAVSYLAWPMGIETTSQVILFILWAIALVLLAIQFFYDLKWLLIPRIVTLMLLVVAIAYALVYFFGMYGGVPILMGDYLLNLGLSLLVLPGFYLLLYVISRRQWIGWGDIELLVPMAIMISSWSSGILLIFLANFVGCLVVLPGLLMKRLSRMSRIPFGPFLIIAFVVTVLWGSDILNMYMGNFLFKP